MTLVDPENELSTRLQQLTDHPGAAMTLPLLEGGVADPLREQLNALQAELARREEQEQEQERELESLRRQQQAFLRLQALTHTGYSEYEVDEGRYRASKEWYAIYGLDPSEVLDRERTLQLVHPEDRARVEAALQLSISERALFDQEYRLLLPNSQVKWVRARAQQMYSDSGAHVRACGTLSDVTEQKLRQQEIQRLQEVELQGLEAELLRSNQLLRISLQVGGLGSFQLDLQSSNITCDSRCYRLLGVPADQPMTLSWQAPMCLPRCAIRGIASFSWKRATTSGRSSP